jgi:formylmethanofuran dehydrogenase subunit C
MKKTTIFFKLKQKSSKKSKLDLLFALENQFQIRAEKVFPDTETTDLVNIFEIIVNANEENQFLDFFSKMSVVEYTEIEAKRYLTDI